MSPTEAARAWVEAWSEGWQNHEHDVIAHRYADDCEFLSHPLRELRRGRQAVADYTRHTFAEERSARFAFAEPIVDSDGCAAVEYRAVITATDESISTLAGTTLLRFNAEGLVVEHRDYWAMTEGDLGLDPPWRTIT